MAAVCTLVVGSLCATYSNLCLAQTSLRFGCASYAGCARVTLGKGAEVLINALIGATLTLVIATFCAVISDSLQGLLEGTKSADVVDAPQAVGILLAAVSLPLSLLPDMSALRFTSTASLVAVFLVLGVLVVGDAKAGVPTAAAIPLSPPSAARFLCTLPVLLLCFGAQAQVPPIVDSLAHVDGRTRMRSATKQAPTTPRARIWARPPPSFPTRAAPLRARI